MTHTETHMHTIQDTHKHTGYTYKHGHRNIDAVMHLHRNIHTQTHVRMHKLTLVVQLCTVLAEAFQPHPLTQEVQELLEGRACSLIIIHLFLCALPSSAVQDPDLVLEAQLQWEETQLTWRRPLDWPPSSQVKTGSLGPGSQENYTRKYPEAERCAALVVQAVRNTDQAQKPQD